MILEAILKFVYLLITNVLSVIPDLPSFNVTILDSVSTVINLIFSNTGLLGFFVRVSTIRLFVPLIVAVLYFEDIYKLTMWVITKLPIGVKSS